MKRISIGLLFSFLIITLQLTELKAAPMASPLEQEPLIVITSPRNNAVVRGRVVITGSAFLSDFWKYEVHYAAEPGGGWKAIGLVHEVPVIEGQLAIWDTTLVPDGRYSLRLRVVHKDGNYGEYFVRGVSVANAQPLETPTPEATPTSPPLPPTPTSIIEQPSPPPTPTPTPSPSAAATPRPTRPSTFALNMQGIGRSFCYGAGAAGGLFLLVGLLTLLRWLISKL